MELPAWADCCVAETEERATALETFIYCNEPAGEEEVEQFRSMLLAVLEEATCPGCEAAAQERDDLRAGILRVIEDYPRDIKQDAEEALRALVAGTVAPVSGDSDLRARLAALLSARTPPYVSEIECNAYARGRADVLEEIRALLAETEAK